MILATVGEMLNFPFMNRFGYDRADHGPSGAYTALFTKCWSVSHLMGHTLGPDLVARFGYEVTWSFIVGLLLLTIAMFIFLKRMIGGKVP